MPLDDCLYALQATIPHFTRSSLHRCLPRHDISRLPDVEDGKARKRKFKAYPIGYFHIDITEVRTQEGRLYLFVAIDRTSKFAFTELHAKATTAVSREFLLHLIAAVPYKIHTVLTDNGLHFTDPRGTRWTAAAIKELIARNKPFRYETHDQRRSHLADFVTAYNFANRLKTLKGLTPYKYICKLWTKEPDRSPSARSSKCRD